MRIVNRATFLALPAGTLFSKYEPCCFGPITIKGISFPNDFLEQQIADAVMSCSSDVFVKDCDAMQAGESRGVDLECEGRDGCFDDDQLFAVWERDDHKALIARLTTAFLDAFPALMG